MLTDPPASGQAPRIGRGRNRIVEFGELGRHCSYVCETEGDHNEDPAAAIMVYLLKTKV